MNDKTHKSALVIVPPDTVLKPVQALRARHDRQADRWMPHINLLYPFRPMSQLHQVSPKIAAVLAKVQPFDVTLSEVRLFNHRGGGHTLWLAPEPHGPLVSLQRRLLSAFPDCDDTARMHGGYMPHLSIGQVQGLGRAKKLQQQITEAWEPLCFSVDVVSLITRIDPPNDRFKVTRKLALGVELDVEESSAPQRSASTRHSEGRGGEQRRSAGAKRAGDGGGRPPRRNRPTARRRD